MSDVLQELTLPVQLKLSGLKKREVNQLIRRVSRCTEDQRDLR